MATDVLDDGELGFSDINKYDFHTDAKPVFKARKGVDAEIVNQISEMKDEPDWMRQFRLKSFEIFQSKPMPSWVLKTKTRSSPPQRSGGSGSTPPAGSGQPPRTWRAQLQCHARSRPSM